jgi:hypothetical protein
MKDGKTKKEVAEGYEAQVQDTAPLGKLCDTFGMILGGAATEFEYHLQLSSGVFFFCIV